MGPGFPHLPLPNCLVLRRDGVAERTGAKPKDTGRHQDQEDGHSRDGQCDAEPYPASTRRERTALWLGWDSSRLSPGPRRGQSPLGVLDAAAVDPEEQKQETVEGQEAGGPGHKVAEGGG